MHHSTDKRKQIKSLFEYEYNEVSIVGENRPIVYLPYFVA